MSNAIDIEEAFKCAYLTMRGWEYNRYTQWTKTNFVREFRQRRAGCNCCSEDVTSESFSLDQAFDAQKESESEVSHG